MKSITHGSKLKASSRDTLNEILTQLNNQEEALNGIEATILTRSLVYQRGEFVTRETSKEQRVLGGEQNLDDLINPNEIFASEKYRIEELPGKQHNTLRIQVRPARAAKLNITKPDIEHHQAAIAVISRSPARLLEMELFLVNIPWWIMMFVHSFETKVEFTYIRETPVPTKMISRMRSIGIGPLCFGGGMEIDVHYQE